MKGMTLTIVSCITCGMVVPIAASAQVTGERIRVTLPSERIVGVLAETRPDQLVLALVGEGGGLRTVAYDDIQRLERSLGMRRQAGKWSEVRCFGRHRRWNRSGTWIVW